MSALVQLLGLERLGELVDEVGRAEVVEVVDAEQALDLLDPFFGRDDRALFLVDLVVGLTGQAASDAGELVVQAGRLVGGAGDDERRPRLVDEDRVHFVDDRIGVTALDHVLEVPGHVVAQVVKTELGVGAVGDVAVVGVLLVLPLGELGRDPANRKAKEPVHLAHPVRRHGRQGSR